MIIDFILNNIIGNNRSSIECQSADEWRRFTLNILVMGGTSFVSKVFAMYAIELGYTVDIFTRGKNEIDYEGVRNHIVGDRHSKEDLLQVNAYVYDYIVDINAYTKDDVKLLAENVQKHNLKRYVLCSTASVYMAPEKEQMISEQSPVGYDAFFGGDYGLNKLEAEEYLFASDIDTTVFRPTYIYGEHSNVYREAFLFDSIKRGRITVLEDSCHVNFIYVKDLVKCFESCFHVAASVNQAYNLANDEKITWSTWLKAGLDACGEDVEVKTYRWEDAKNLEDQVFPFAGVDMLLDTQKLKAHGLHVPKTTFSTGIKNAFEWYQSVDPSVVDKRRFELI